MNKNKKTNNKGLGSGLSSLLGKEFDKKSIFTDNNNQFKMIPIDFIEPGPWQPRKIFDKKEIESLAQSILKQGIIQPIIVKPILNKKNKYFLIAGERRWRASQVAKIHEIPSIVRDDIKEENVAELSLVENIQRSELNPIEEAEGYLSLIEKYNYTQEDISKAVGKSRSYIANMTRLVSLSDMAKEYLLNNKLTVGQLRPLIGQQNCDQFLEIIVKNNLTSRQVEKLVRKVPSKTITKNIDIVNLEKELQEITGLKTSIKFDEKKELGQINFKCKNLSEFNYIIKKIRG